MEGKHRLALKARRPGFSAWGGASSVACGRPAPAGHGRRRRAGWARRYRGWCHHLHAWHEGAFQRAREATESAL